MTIFLGLNAISIFLLIYTPKDTHICMYTPQKLQFACIPLEITKFVGVPFKSSNLCVNYLSRELFMLKRGLALKTASLAELYGIALLQIRTHLPSAQNCLPGRRAFKYTYHFVDIEWSIQNSNVINY